MPFRAMLREKISPGGWIASEDECLSELVAKAGCTSWTSYANALNDRFYGGKAVRTGKQCRERWHNKLQSNIRLEPFSEAEQEALIEAHKQHPNKWTLIAAKLHNRTANHTKNYMNAATRMCTAVVRAHNGDDLLAAVKRCLQHRSRLMVEYLVRQLIDRQGSVLSPEEILACIRNTDAANNKRSNGEGSCDSNTDCMEPHDDSETLAKVPHLVQPATNELSSTFSNTPVASISVPAFSHTIRPPSAPAPAPPPPQTVAPPVHAHAHGPPVCEPVLRRNSWPSLPEELLPSACLDAEGACGSGPAWDSLAAVFGSLCGEGDDLLPLVDAPAPAPALAPSVFRNERFSHTYRTPSPYFGDSPSSAPCLTSLGRPPQASYYTDSEDPSKSASTFQPSPRRLTHSGSGVSMAPAIYSSQSTLSDFETVEPLPQWRSKRPRSKNMQVMWGAEPSELPSSKESRRCDVQMQAPQPPPAERIFTEAVLDEWAMHDNPLDTAPLTVRSEADNLHAFLGLQSPLMDQAAANVRSF